MTTMVVGRAPSAPGMAHRTHAEVAEETGDLIKLLASAFREVLLKKLVDGAVSDHRDRHEQGAVVVRGVRLQTGIVG
jgi:hypothetical protein